MPKVLNIMADKKARQQLNEDRAKELLNKIIEWCETQPHHHPKIEEQVAEAEENHPKVLNILKQLGVHDWT